MKRLVLISTLLFSTNAIAASPDDCGRNYKVLPGETLSVISRDVYGTVDRYRDIYVANRAAIGTSPDNLAAGMEIFIPCTSERPVRTAGINLKPLTPVSAEGAPQPSGIAPLMEGVDLLALLGTRNLQVIDLRTEKDALEVGYVPGSTAVPFSAWRGPQADPGRPPTDADLSDLLSTAGLRPGRPTVIVPAKDHVMHFARASYVYWILKSAGFERLGILDGGAQRWERSGFDTAARPVEARSTRTFVTLSDTWRANALEVAAVASGQKEGALLDARPEGFFRRQKAGVLVPSTLHGAQNLESIKLHKATVNEADTDLSILSKLKAQRVDWESVPVINFCSDGTLGAVNWFFASEVAGIQNVKLFPESIRGWQGDGNPVTIGTLGDRLSP
ncbi:MAG: rhodanese-like domain-containing protein [Pseudomonadota bacterium]